MIEERKKSVETPLDFVRNELSKTKIPEGVYDIEIASIVGKYAGKYTLDKPPLPESKEVDKKIQDYIFNQTETLLDDEQQPTPLSDTTNESMYNMFEWMKSEGLIVKEGPQQYSNELLKDIDRHRNQAKLFNSIQPLPLSEEEVKEILESNEHDEGGLWDFDKAAKEIFSKLSNKEQDE